MAVLSVTLFTCQVPNVWREYRSPDGAFTAQFPGDAEVATRTSPLTPEVKYPVVTWNEPGLKLEIVFQEIPNLRPLSADEAKEYYEFLRTQTIKLNHSQLMESNDIALGGKPAADYTEVRAAGRVARHRLVLLGTKLLALNAEQDVGVKPQSETSPTVDQFMASLKINN